MGTGTSTGVPYIGCKCAVCSSADPRDKRLRCSSLLDVDGVKVLLDCGPDFRQQALANGIDRIDALLLTHEHVDHMMGIDDLRPFGKVDVYANELTCRALHRVYAYCFNNDYPGIPSLSLHEIDDRPFTAAGVEVIPVAALHYCLPVFGYRIRNFAYLTDVKYISDVELEKLKGLDLFVIDALRQKSHLSHPSLSEALRIVEKIRPRDTFLVHMSHDFGLHFEQERLLPSHVHIAYDGLRVSF